jgi:hypothetical protein
LVPFCGSKLAIAAAALAAAALAAVEPPELAELLAPAELLALVGLPPLGELLLAELLHAASPARTAPPTATQAYAFILFLIHIAPLHHVTHTLDLANGVEPNTAHNSAASTARRSHARG